MSKKHEYISNIFLRRLFVLKKLLRRVAASVLAAAAVCACAVTASAGDRSDYLVKESHDWYSNHIGGGAPSSLDTVDHFILKPTGRGYKGECKTLVCSDPHGYSAKLSCYDCDYTIDNADHEITWYYTTTQGWYVKGDGPKVKCKVVSYGYCSSSSGTASIK